MSVKIVIENRAKKQVKQNWKVLPLGTVVKSKDGHTAIVCTHVKKGQSRGILLLISGVNDFQTAYGLLPRFDKGFSIVGKVTSITVKEGK